MTFWSGKTLLRRLPELIDAPDDACVDGAAYMLKVGPEYYVTPNDRTADPHATTIKRLDAGQAFSIPAGQFGYILSEESVSVPTDALAFISIRARVKWKGLVNVSGFHVDPGYKGRLLFAVYNAGPVSIHLRRGDAVFLIWFAGLDEDSPEFAKDGTPVTKIDTQSITQVAGEIYSVHGLADKIRGTEKELSERIGKLERANAVIYVIAGMMITVTAAFAGQWLIRHVMGPEAQPAQVQLQQNVPQITTEENRALPPQPQLRKPTETKH
jgi:dCTP deaminase